LGGVFDGYAHGFKLLAELVGGFPVFGFAGGFPLLDEVFGFRRQRFLFGFGENSQNAVDFAD